MCVWPFPAAFTLLLLGTAPDSNTKKWAPDWLQLSSFDDLCQSAGASCVCATSAVAVLHFYLENTMISNSNDRLVDGPRVDL